MGNPTSSNKSKKRILVVLPTLGERTALLRQTLESVANQKPVQCDIVMIFPLKNKATRELAKEFGAVMVDDPGGISAAVNAGIAAAKPEHKYITWIGDDDLLTPHSLGTTIKALDENPDAVVAFGYCDYINSHGKHIFTSRAGRLAPWIMKWGPNLVPMPGLLIRLSALQLVGKFDIDNKYSMDLDMLLRLQKIGRFINTKKTLACFRWHESSQTVSSRPKVIQETEAVKRKHLPKYLRDVAPIWEQPVRFATSVAARRVNKMASRL